jgi:hypothetical protein
MQFRLISFVLFALIATATLRATDAKLSRQQADSFQQKILLIADQAEKNARAGARRTPLSESELNSWFAYHAQPLIPRGISEPVISIVGQGKLSGRAIVDLDTVAKKRATGGMLDPWSYVGGKMPVAVTGILHTKDGIGRFQVERAEVSGVPVPKVLLQELVAYYTRTENHPNGVNVDDPFELPANIRQIEVGQGQAVVVQ